MSKDLFDRAEEKGIDGDGSWVKIAFNEILGTIYHSEVKEEELDKLIEEMASILFEKLNIKEEELDWQKVEEWQFKEVCNLISYDDEYLTFNEAKKIISKAKVSKNSDWEDMSSGAMDIKNINKKILENFNEEIEDYKNTDEKTFKEFIEKGIYINFRQKATK